MKHLLEKRNGVKKYMYINPNSNIRLLHNVPLDNTYDHTLWFDSKQVQSNYFIGLTKKNFTEQSYLRVHNGVARLDVKADDIYDCNYMMFQNTAYGNKWFYAFINSIEYINDNCSQINFEIDVMQTWFFDYKLEECFVEREHSITDELFGNVVAEKLELGEYISNNKETFNMMPMCVCALTSKHSSGQPATGKTINNIYTPLNVIAGVPSTYADEINVLLERFVGAGQEDSIVTLYQYPEFLGDGSQSEPVTKVKKISPNLTTIDGYTPKNKKLFTYPYNYLVVSNNCGQTAEYQWEMWNDPQYCGHFSVQGVFVSTPCVLAYPQYYRGCVNDYDSGLTYSNFPQIPWVGDTYKAWLAQNKGALTSSLISTAVGAGLVMGGAEMANPFYVSGGIESIYYGVSSAVAQGYDKSHVPPQVHGQVQCDSLNAGTSRVEFTFYSMSIRKQYAKIIDNYFSMFGYATNDVKTPNRNSRPHWNYVKTIGCVLTGSVPSDDSKTICKIYDNGITFWKHGNEVGNYSLDNRPV